jgi:hypothetical protein
MLRLFSGADGARMQTELPRADPPKRKRRWFQFSLRTLMIFTLFLAIGCGLMARRVEQKRNEREAVDAIVKLGGHVHYDNDHGPFMPMSVAHTTNKPPGPD